MDSANLIPVTGILTGMFVPMAGMAMIVLIVWFVHTTSRRRFETRAELTRNLIDKFSTGEAFASAMQGPEGERLTRALSLQDTSEPRWVGLLVPGSILTGLGLGFFVLAIFKGSGFAIPGVICCSVGAGLLVSAYVARRAGTRNADRTGDSRDLTVSEE